MGLFHKDDQVEAEVSKEGLVAVFRKASPALIWKFDLERNHSFSLSLQGEAGEWELGVTSTKGDFAPVAHFTTREDADKAFEIVQRALTRKKVSAVWWVAKILIALVILVITGLFARSFLTSMSFLKFAGNTPAPHFSTFKPPTMLEGVPMPADNYLQMPPTEQYKAGHAAPVPKEPVKQGVPLPADDVLQSIP